MCGIFGYSGRNEVDLLRLSWLAAENQIRGDDSTGVYGHVLAKAVGSAKNFVLTDDFREAVIGAKTIIGHTRRATMGAKTIANSHPFDITEGRLTDDWIKDTDNAGKDFLSANRVVGTHNGQIFEYVLDTLCKKHLINKPDVDSQFIYQLLTKNNFDYNETLSAIDGAMALAFIRPKYPDYLYLYHRTSRPLHVGFIDSDMYYSSESEPLHLIGCESIDALDTDKIYTFKHGALLGVSAVKKPRIITIKEDQGLTAWINSTATDQEKNVLGICGVDVNKHQNARITKRQRQDYHTRAIVTDGGQSSLFQGSASGNRKPGELLLLPKLNEKDFHYESFDPPAKGKFYSSGNLNCCYLMFKLVDTRDSELAMPAWMVRSAAYPDISAITTYTGLGVLEIPIGICGKAHKIEVVNPLKPSVIYTTTIDRPVAGRVMEVALSIPFQVTQEKEESNKGNTFSKFRNNSNTGESEGQDNILPSFSIWLEIAKGNGVFTPYLSKQSSNLQIGIGSQMGTHNHLSEIGYARVDSPERNNKLRARVLEQLNQLDGPLEFYYDEETDILVDMDLHSTAKNLDETNLHIAAIEEALSAIDDGPKKCQEALMRLEPYLKYWAEYLDSRLDALNFHEGPTTNDMTLVD